MELASPEKVIFGSIAFLIFWVLAVFPSMPILPVGRTAGSLIGAVLMVVFRVISPEDAYSAIDLPVISLLFATMVVGAYLQKADMFKYIGKFLSWKCAGPKDLLCRVSAIAAVSSALFTNDTTCVVLTKFVLDLAARNGHPPHPFLLALASSANIGSSCTPIGNPQNLVIAIQSKLSFGEFFVGLITPTVVGVAVNSLFLLCLYWGVLSSRDENSPPRPIATRAVNDDDVSMVEDDAEAGRTGEEPMSCNRIWRSKAKKLSVYLVTAGMVACMLIGLNMSWTAVTAATVLAILDFKDARSCLDEVSYSLLVFFCGMFITVQGFNRTGIPGKFWSMIERYAQINHVKGFAVLAIVVLFLSNLLSNVPTVLLLGGRVSASGSAISTEAEEKAWLILAWVSSVAGNLTLFGSAANLIVCEEARHSSKLPYILSFWSHLKFGVPSTTIVTTIGLALMRIQ